MTMQQEALFEAPVAHEAHYSNPYSNPELEWETHEAHYTNPEGEWEAHEAHYSNPYSNPEGEWETHEAHYSNPEAEWESHEAHYSNPYSNPEAEWETHETHYSNPYSNPELEWEAHETHYSNPYSNPELEWETHETHYSNPYSNPELEWETHESHYSNPYAMPELEGEWEDEGEYFFKRVWSGIRRVGKLVAPLAKRLAPFAAKALVGMIPGVGAIAAPLAGKLTAALVREAEMEVAALEAEFFGTNEAEVEIANSEVAHEAALTEMMAAEAASAESEAEAEAELAAALPITITIMGGRRALRPVLPTLTQANARLVRVLRSQGPGGRQLLRTVPAIQRRTVATLRAAARRGQPISGPLAIRAMASATQGVLGNPRRVQRTFERNALLRTRVAPPTPRRRTAVMPGRVPPYNPRRVAYSNGRRMTSSCC
jgi:hypothetical protein